MHLSDINHFLRPNLWLFVLAVYLTASLAAKADFSFPYLLLVPVFIMICSASITLNHYCDYAGDRKSRQIYRFPVAGGTIARETALLVSIALMAIPLLLAHLFLGAEVLYLLLFADFMIVSYSARPFRIKERAYLETLWNGLGYGSLPYYISLFASGAEATANLHLLGLVPFFVAASGHILLQVRDIRDDTKARVATTSTRLGSQKMVLLSKVFVAAAGLIIAYLAAVHFLNYFAWLSLAAGAGIYLEHKRMRKIEKSYRRLKALYAIGGVFFFLSLL